MASETGESEPTLAALDARLTEHLILEYGAKGAWAVENLASAEVLVRDQSLPLPRRTSIVAYCLREALKAIPESAAVGSEPSWRALAKEIQTARDEYLEAVHTQVEDDVSERLTHLLRKIDEIDDVVRRQSHHQKRLISIVIAQSGAEPLTSGIKPIEDYQHLISRLDRIVHNNNPENTSPGAMWNEAVGMLRRLFLPPDIRRVELSNLAAVVAPTESDLDALRPLLVTPQHLDYFVRQTVDPGWLRLLFEADLLTPVAGPAPWPMLAGVKRFHPEHDGFLVALLAEMLESWKPDEHLMTDPLRGGHIIGMSARGLTLTALSVNGSSEVFVAFALWAVQASDPSDGFVAEVADRVLNVRPWQDKSLYVEPILEALVVGVTLGNFDDRVRLLCNKLRGVDSETTRYRALFNRGRLGETPTVGADLPQDALIKSLVECLLRGVSLGLYYEQLLWCVERLPTELQARFRSWILGNAPDVPTASAVVELASAISGREPTGDDIELAAHALQTHPEHLDDLRRALGDLPDTVEVGQQMSEGGRPASEWIRAYLWSAILPADVCEAWQDTISLMSARWGMPSAESLAAVGGWHFETTNSPISAGDLAAMSPDDATAWIADRQSTDRMLANVLREVVKLHVVAWSEDPIRIVGQLRDPLYIEAYIHGIAESDELPAVDPERLVTLLQVVATHPWPASSFSPQIFSEEAGWGGTDTAVIELIRALGSKDVGFGQRGDEAWSLVASAVAALQSDDDDVDPHEDYLAQAMSNRGVRALDAACSVIAYEYRARTSIEPDRLELLGHALSLTGTVGAMARTVLATRVGLLRWVDADWMEEHGDALFGSEAPADLRLVAIDAAVKWGTPNRWLLKSYRREVRGAVKRDIENALEVYIIGMLWAIPGYSPDEMVADLRSRDLLSSSGEAVGRLLRTDGVTSELVDIGVAFWRSAIASGSSDLAGFGWMSEISAIDDQTWVELTLRTVQATSGVLDWSQEVASRLEAASRSTSVLAILNLMLRGLKDVWDFRIIGALGARVLMSSPGLEATEEYTRLKNVLIERGLLDPDA
jgi:hypothetical protein